MVKSEDDRPRALLTPTHDSYEVALTSECENEVDRFLYQFAHEATHFYLDPTAREHCFTEIACVAVSLMGLSWEKHARFARYRDRVEMQAVRSGRRMHRGCAGTSVEDEHVVEGARLAREVLEVCEVTWRPLVELKTCLVFGMEIGQVVHLVDFDRWENTCRDKHEFEFVTRCRDAFEDLFGCVVCKGEGLSSKRRRASRRVFKKCWFAMKTCCN